MSWMILLKLNLTHEDRWVECWIKKSAKKNEQYCIHDYSRDLHSVLLLLLCSSCMFFVLDHNLLWVMLVCEK